MRWIFLLLVLANAAFFGYMQFNGTRAEESITVHAPFNADKVHLLGIAPPPGAKPAKPLPATPQVCLEWGSFASADLEKAKQAVEKLHLGDKITVRSVGEHITYWVLIPPLKSKQDTDKKMAEIKALGVDDVALVQNGDKLHNIISLGVFSTAEVANNYLTVVRGKGIRSAKVEARGKGGNQASLFVQDASEAVSAELVKIKLDFPGSELKAVACEATVQPQSGDKK
jgi:hypothetical protein